MKKKLKRKIRKWINQQTVPKGVVEACLEGMRDGYFMKMQNALEGIRNEMASHNKRIAVLELRYGIVSRGNVAVFERKSKKQHAEVDEIA